MQADLGTLDGPKHLISETVRWAASAGVAAKIDILVNNAGLERVKGLDELSVEDYNAVFDVNVRGTILLTQAALPYLNPDARIVNISSVGARAGFKNLGLYCSSKAAIGMIVLIQLCPMPESRDLHVCDCCPCSLSNATCGPFLHSFSRICLKLCSLVKLMHANNFRREQRA